MSDKTLGVGNTGGTDTPAPKSVNPFLKALMIIIAVPAMLVWESAKSLCRWAYEEHGGFVSTVLGVLAALGAGIGTGYYLGWEGHATFWKWLPAGVGAMVLTFVYLWPLLYLGVVKQIFKLSETLWDAVDSGKYSKSWFTHALVYLGRVAIFLGSAYTAWDVLLKVHSGLNIGWPGYLVGAAVGALAAIVVGAIGWGILSFGRLGAIAVASGVGLTYVLASQTQALLSYLGFAGEGVLGNGLVLGAYVLEFLVYVGYVFPLVHIIMTHGFAWVGDVLDWLDKEVYQEEKGGYREFALQVANIWTVWHLTALSIGLWSLLGVSAPVAVYVLSGLVVLLSYLLVGEIYNQAGNRLVSIIVAGHVAVLTFVRLFEVGAWLTYGNAVAVGITAVSAAVAYFVAFPILYLIIRFIASPLLASWLRKPLVWLHENAYKLAGDLVEEIGEAASNTYGDKTSFRNVFLHVANLASVVGIGFVSLAATKAMGFATWLVVGTVVLAVVLAYLLVGKLLLKAGNAFVGTLASLGAAVYGGAYANAAQPYGLYVAIPVGLIVAALTFGLIFPVAYIFVRALGRLIQVESWLLPVLSGIHTYLWNGFASLWEEFLQIYRAVRDWFRPFWASVRKAWHEAWESVKQAWEEATGRRR